MTAPDFLMNEPTPDGFVEDPDAFMDFLTLPVRSQGMVDAVDFGRVVHRFTLDVKRKRVYSSTHDSIVCL